MIYRIIALAIMAIFYGIYFLKMILQRRKGIKTNQLGQQDVPKKVQIIQLLLRSFSAGIVLAELISIILGNAMLGYTGRGILLKVFGTYVGVIGDIVFFLAVYTMRDSWRAGLATDDETEMVTRGIYGISRNPAFLGFYLVYIGILLMYFNIPLLIITFVTIVVFHLQIIEEEKYLTDVFGQQYEEYKNNVHRYLGMGKWNWKKIRCFAYFLCFIFSVFYYITCICYVGPGLSFVWIWLLAAVFSLFRILILGNSILAEEKGIKQLFKIPRVVSIIYQVIFTICACIFLYVETNVVIAMNTTPPEELDYIIVLGASTKGYEPSKPLAMRIQKAYNYLERNPETLAIVSGGTGNDEPISEAEVMYSELVARGIDGERIIKEDKSMDTIENIRYSFQFIPDETRVGLVTNSFHIYRARMIATSQGHFDVYGVPAQTLFPIGIHYVVREFFGVGKLMLQLWGI